jgi:hypothetical protein
MNKYLVLLDGGESGETEIIAKTDENAIEKAIQWTKEGDWFSIDNHGFITDKTVYIRISIRKSTGEQITPLDYRIDPPEPECEEEKHDWELINDGNELLYKCNNCRFFKTITWENDYDFIQYSRPKGD